jgi:hypothetical protein
MYSGRVKYNVSQKNLWTLLKLHCPKIGTILLKLISVFCNLLKDTHISTLHFPLFIPARREGGGGVRRGRCGEEMW